MTQNTPVFNPRFPINPPVLTVNGAGEPWLVAALYDGPDLKRGRISAWHEGMNQPVDLTPQTAFYAPPQAQTDVQGRLWAIFTEGYDAAQRIVLAGLDTQGHAMGCRALTDWGIYDRPSLDASGDGLRLAWEHHSVVGSVIETMVLKPTDALDESASMPKPIILTPENGRAYRPLPVSDGQGGLYVIYECFQGGRYRLIAAVTDPVSGAITSAAEIGFAEHNDMCASVCTADGYLLVAWENSRPLRKGDEMIGTTIPAFGHGWRFETRMGLRRVAFTSGKWQVENLGSLDSQLIDLDESTSSGCPRIFTDAQGRIHIAWMAFTRDRRGWGMHVSRWDGVAWLPVETPELTMRERVTPAVGYSPQGTIMLAGQTAEGGELLAASIEGTPGQAESPSFSTAGDWHTVKSSDMVDAAEKRPSIDNYGTKLSLFWGDLHMHSNISICSLHSEFHCTELENKYRFTRDVGKMDFAMVTDHDVMSDRDWNRTSHAANLFNMPGNFVAFPGYEWTSSMLKDRKNFGHYCVLFLEDGPLLRVHEDSGDSVEELWAAIPAGRSLTIPHHPSDSVHPLDWNYFNPDFEPLVEIFQVRGSYEYDGCPFDPTKLGRGIAPPGHSVRDGLAHGYRFGFTSGGEHEGVGVTGVYAESLTREGIFDALKKRHTFGTTGARFAVEFRVGGHLMGEVCRASESPSIVVRIQSESPITELRLVRDGKTLKTWTDLGKNVDFTWRDETMTGEALAEDHYYYIAATREDGEMAWASPVFLKGA